MDFDCYTWLEDDQDVSWGQIEDHSDTEYKIIIYVDGREVFKFLIAKARFHEIAEAKKEW